MGREYLSKATAGFLATFVLMGPGGAGQTWAASPSATAPTAMPSHPNDELPPSNPLPALPGLDVPHEAPAAIPNPFDILGAASTFREIWGVVQFKTPDGNPIHSNVGAMLNARLSFHCASGDYTGTAKSMGNGEFSYSVFAPVQAGTLTLTGSMQTRSGLVEESHEASVLATEDHLSDSESTLPVTQFDWTGKIKTTNADGALVAGADVGVILKKGTFFLYTQAKPGAAGNYDFLLPEYYDETADNTPTKFEIQGCYFLGTKKLCGTTFVTGGNDEDLGTINVKMDVQIN